MRLLPIAVVLAAIATPLAAQQAASPASTCDTLQSVLAKLDGYGEKHVELSAKSLLGVDAVGLGAIIVATFEGKLVLGVEVNGCVVGPISVAPLTNNGVGT